MTKTEPGPPKDIESSELTPDSATLLTPKIAPFTEAKNIASTIRTQTLNSSTPNNDTLKEDLSAPQEKVNTTFRLKVSSCQKKLEDIQRLADLDNADLTALTQLLDQLLEEIEQLHNQLNYDNFNLGKNEIPSFSYVEEQALAKIIFMIKIKTTYLKTRLKYLETDPSILKRRKVKVETQPIKYTLSWHTPSKESSKQPYSRIRITLYDDIQIDLIVPSKYENLISEKAIELIEMAETILQNELNSNGISPSATKNIQITIVKLRNGRSYYFPLGSGSIFLDIRTLKDLENEESINLFLNTYIHERTHSIFSAQFVPLKELREGIASYYTRHIADLLRLDHESQPSQATSLSIENELEQKRTLLEAFKTASSSRTKKPETKDCYEYGGAFVEAFIRHCGVKKFWELYKGASSIKSFFLAMKTRDFFKRFQSIMAKAQIDKDLQSIILEDTARIILCRGNSNMDMLEELLNTAEEESMDKVKQFLETQNIYTLLRLTTKDPEMLKYKIHQMLNYLQIIESETVENEYFNARRKNIATLKKLLHQKFSEETNQVSATAD